MKRVPAVEKGLLTLWWPLRKGSCDQMIESIQWSKSCYLWNNNWNYFYKTVSARLGLINWPGEYFGAFYLQSEVILTWKLQPTIFSAAVAWWCSIHPEGGEWKSEYGFDPRHRDRCQWTAELITRRERWQSAGALIIQQEFHSQSQYRCSLSRLCTIPQASIVIKDRNYIFITQNIAACLFITCLHFSLVFCQLTSTLSTLLCL